MYIYIYIWVNCNDLTATSLEIIVSKGNHPKMALIQVSEKLQFTQIYIYIVTDTHLERHLENASFFF